LKPPHLISFVNKTAIPFHVNRPHLEETDIIVFNLGVHLSHKDLITDLDAFKNLTFLAAEDGHISPRFVYVTTPTQHFQTNTGQYTKKKGANLKHCESNVKRNPRRDIEIQSLVTLEVKDTNSNVQNVIENITLVDTSTMAASVIQNSNGNTVYELFNYGDDLNKGSYHIAFGDCTHYCMPGIPDIVAARLYSCLVSPLKVF
jgi:hypothetical protein